MNAYTLFSISCETNYNQWDSLQQMSPYGFFEKLEKIHLNKDEAVKVLNIISKANTSIKIWHGGIRTKCNILTLPILISFMKHELIANRLNCNGSIGHFFHHQSKITGNDSIN